MRLGPLVLVVLTLAASARGEERPPAPPPCAFVPVPSLAELDALERSGRHKRTAGVALLASGGGLVVLGAALTLAGALDDDDDDCFDDGRRFDRRWGYPDGCSNRGLTYAGASVAIIGSAALLAGFPLYTIGADQVAHARWLRRYRVLAPSVRASPRGASISLGATF